MINPKDIEVAFNSKQLKSGDVVVFRCSKLNVETKDILQGFLSYFNAQNIRVMLIAIDRDHEISIVPEEQMNKMGWFRKPSESTNCDKEDCACKKR